MPEYLDEYEPVEDRLREFWGDHKPGNVLTDLVTPDARDPGDVIIFRAEVYRGDVDAARSRPAATGYAHQRILAEPPPRRDGRPNESAPEWTSPWEVAETSAIGRALANLGYAAKGKRPSREEVSKSDAVPSRAGTAAPDRSGEGAAEAENAGPDTSPEPHPSAPGSESAPAGGAGSSEVPPAGARPRTFPVDPLSCDHRTAAGRWVRWVPYDGDEVCPKCGTPKLLALEATTADLGPAEGGYS